MIAAGELRATAIDAAGDAFARDGYLLVRGLIDVERVGELDRAVMTVLAEQELLEPGPDPVAKFRATRAEYARAFQRVEAFHALAYDPGLLSVVRAMVGADAFVHPKKLLRAIWPDVPELTTTAHQDLVYIGGAASTVTAWVPLRACAAHRGALRVLVGSHRDGLVKNVPDVSVSGARADVADDDPRWASADVEPGDVILFSAMTVHGATHNTSGLRLSADFRYQSASDPIASRSLVPTGFPAVPDWPELLADCAWRERWLSVPACLHVV